MADDLTLETKLKSSADTSGATEMGEGLTGVGRAAEAVQTQVEALMASFAALFALTELISFFKDATAEAEKLEIAMRGVDFAAGKMGVTSADLREKVDKLSVSLGGLGGVAQGEVAASLAKLLVETNNYDEAAARATLAMKVSTNTGMAYSEALSIVERAARGQVRGIQQLTGEMLTATGAHDKATQAMDALNKKFGDMKISLDDEAGSLQRSAASWANFKESVGSIALKAVSNFIENIKLIGPQVTHAQEWVRQAFEAMAGYIGVVVQWIKDKYSPGWETANEKAQAGFKATNAAFSAGMAKADADLKASGEKRAAELNAQIAKELGLKAHANAEMKKGDDEVLRNVMSDREAELRHADAVETLLDAHYAEGVNKRLAMDKKEEEERLKLVALGNKALIQKLDEKTLALKNAAKEETALAEQVAKYKLDLETQVLNGGLQMAGDAFGIGKEIAIAEAIVNTYAGAAKALAQGGIYGGILAALVIALGLEDIAKITSTSSPSAPGINPSVIQGASGSPGGFDDPANDQAAYIGGRKWASDMIGKFSGGASSVSAGWAGGMGASTVTNNNSHTTNINLSGGGLPNPNDHEGLKQLGRKLAIVMQSDSQRTFARKT